MKYCEHCGSKIDDHAIFCLNCGQRVDDSRKAEQDDSLVNVDAVESTTEVKDEFADLRNQPVVDRKQPVITKSSRTNGLNIAAMVLIIISLIGAIYTLVQLAILGAEFLNNTEAILDKALEQQGTSVSGQEREIMIQAYKIVGGVIIAGGVIQLIVSCAIGIPAIIMLKKTLKSNYYRVPVAIKVLVLIFCGIIPGILMLVADN